MSIAQRDRELYRRRIYLKANTVLLLEIFFSFIKWIHVIQYANLKDADRVPGEKRRKLKHFNGYTIPFSFIRFAFITFILSFRVESFGIEMRRPCTEDLYARLMEIFEER